MISARSGAPALVLPLALVVAAGLAGPAAASAPVETRDVAGDTRVADGRLTLRPVGSPRSAPGTARVAAASATAFISSCFVYDSFGYVELGGSLTADPAADTEFTIRIVNDIEDWQESVLVPAGETWEFSLFDVTGPTTVTIGSGGATLASASRDVPDCTPTTVSSTYGSDEIVRWDGYGFGEIVSTLTDGNTEWFDLVIEDSFSDTGTAVLVPVQLDGVPGEELMSYDPVTGRQTFYAYDDVVGYTPVSTRLWSKGWDVVTPVQLDGDALSELVVYNSVTGRQVLVNLFANGSTGTYSDRQWSRGWDVVEPVQLDADAASELVVYNSVTGRQVLVNLFSNGTTGTYSDRQWSKGWDTVEPIQLDTDRLSELMVYNSVTGRQVLVNLFASGSTGTFSDRLWSKGWDVVTALESDRTALSEVALYNSATGRHVLIDLKAGGGTGTFIDTYWGRYWVDAVRVNVEGD
ncbi:hypothetical protein [Aquipuribacter nitratireducens]|uniref:hypothetical protein n=1 Tax=Aquipuribacter nitratireducens TaxID=650104 RepID=UPI0030EBF514